MSPPVTLPGDLPGLLRRCAPVHRDGHFGVVSGDFPADGTVPESVADLELDLSDPVGRDIAARWLAERLGMKVGLTAPRFWWSADHDAWCLSSGGRIVVFRPEERVLEEWRDPAVWSYIAISGLVMDPTKGPEALAQICLHVAGRRTT